MRIIPSFKLPARGSILFSSPLQQLTFHRSNIDPFKLKTKKRKKKTEKIDIKVRVNKSRLIGDSRKVEPPLGYYYESLKRRRGTEATVKSPDPHHWFETDDCTLYSPLRCCVLSLLCVNNNSVLIIWLVMSSKANAPGADGLVPSISDTRVHFDNVSLIKLIHLLIIRSTFWQIHAR